MGSFKALLYGLGIGAGLIYFLDPEQGDRRKALVRDKFVSLQHKGDEAVEAAMADMRNKARGFLAEGMAFVNEEGMPDNVLEERVRSRMGFLARHPGAVQVSANQGRVTLSGDMLANEVEDFLAGVRRIRGVKNVENNLRVHQEAGNIPQLQGEGWMPGDSRGSMQWSPSTRMLAGAGAGYLMLYGMARGGLIGLLSRLGSLYLGTRALTNLDMKTMTGRGDHEAVRVRKSINIDAPVEEVYRLWSNFENFPRFMNNVESIRDIGNNRSHWVVKGPVGSKVEFDAITTQKVTNELIAWETTEDSQVKHHGQVRFRETRQGRGTQVNVNMGYTPPAGIAGHAVASLFGKDPKSEMDADLARMKSLLEEGRTTAEGKRVRREEIMPVTGQGTDEDMMEHRDAGDIEEGGETRRNRRRGGPDNMGGMGGGPLTPSDV